MTTDQTESRISRVKSKCFGEKILSDASEKINYDTRYGHIIGLDKMYLAVHNGCYMKEKISTVKAVFVESRFRNLVRLFAPTPF
jgi:hypothetical protein